MSDWSITPDKDCTINVSYIADLSACIWPAINTDTLVAVVAYRETGLTSGGENVRCKSEQTKITTTTKLLRLAAVRRIEVR